MEFADTAVRTVERVGPYLRERFRGDTLDADFQPADVKTEADREAETRALAVIREAHPDHAISAEESGEHAGSAPYRWVVDPLDGTNNFAAGIPTFGVSVALVDDEGPLVAAVGVPLLDDLYLARRNGGVTYNGEPVTAADGDTPPPEGATVAAVLGVDVLEDETLMTEYEALTDGVGGVCKRVVRSWAPVVHWALLARGRLDGFVTFHPDEREQVPGTLLAREAGCAVGGDPEDPLRVFGRDEETRDRLLAAARSALTR
jgi:myo-inositol-1(or 4)-monophosphatase